MLTLSNAILFCFCILIGLSPECGCQRSDREAAYPYYFSFSQLLAKTTMIKIQDVGPPDYRKRIQTLILHDPNAIDDLLQLLNSSYYQINPLNLAFDTIDYIYIGFYEHDNCIGKMTIIDQNIFYTDMNDKTTLIISLTGLPQPAVRLWRMQYQELFIKGELIVEPPLKEGI